MEDLSLTGFMDENSKNAEDWLSKAQNELKAAQGIYGYYEDPPTDMICYHCHQTAEKSLKAFLVFHKISFPKIHDLVGLLNLCLQKDDKLDFLKNDSKILNRYYIEAKYPPDMPVVYAKPEAEEAINKATRVLEAISEKIHP